MFKIKDEHIDFILNDISARGIEMEDLQFNLLDHVCCIIEQNLEEKGDFEEFYRSTIQSFYKKELWEIEEETISLLIFKNYYAMKKIMLITGLFSAFAITIGILSKFMHWPGASMELVLGISASSLIFLPLLFLLKVREKQSSRDKLIIGLGSLAAISLSMGILFKIQHWPMANLLGLSSVIIMFFVFLPIYFFTGIRNPETKVNTIVSSILIIIGCGLLMALVRAPKASNLIHIRNTHDYLRTQEILKAENRYTSLRVKRDSAQSNIMVNSERINELCEELKLYLLEMETGLKNLDEAFESKGVYIEDHTYGFDPFQENKNSQEKYKALLELMQAYNSEIQSSQAGLKTIPTKAMFTEFLNNGYFSLNSSFSILNQLTQIQMFVLQNEQKLLGAN